MDGLSVAIVASYLGKSPKDVSYSFVFDEAYRLSKKGVKVHVVRSVPNGESLSYGMYYHDMKKEGFLKTFTFLIKNLSIYPPISLIRRPVRIYRENLYALNLIRVIEKNKVDLIHSHFAYQEGLVGLLAKKRCGKPLVVSVHGFDVLCEPSVRYGMRLSRRYDAIVRLVLERADAIIAASTTMFNEVKSIVNDQDKVHLIFNGVDVEKFNPRLDGSFVKKSLRIENKKVVFTLRGHKPVYGIEYLIRAIPIVVKERNDVVFVIGGDGPLRDFHENLSSKLGIGDKVIFIGRIPHDETPYYISMSDVVVVPSIQEAFGLIVSEAMACGKPVVGSDVGGIKDQIIDGYNGFLVRPKSPDEIAEKILWLLENPDEAIKMGYRGREIVEKKFNASKRVDNILKLYRSLLKKEE
ncbi:MAG: glycosyltransferase [Candidatus Asgardarchaeia archaeon]